MKRIHWKKQTCRNCYFRLGDTCRRLPSRVKVRIMFGGKYSFHRACYEFVETKEYK